ncbi:relaxase/mobilization nuclease domain-containing protein, partial [Brucellaceae bacterium D45D]
IHCLVGGLDVRVVNQKNDTPYRKVGILSRALRRAADIALRHFGAEDHQAAFMIHEKNRANGKGNRHAHVVVGRVGPGGKVLQSGFEKIKMETATRIAEYELGEPVVIGRHHASCLKWLRANGRNDVADYMEAAHGSKPEQPKSHASSGARHKIERLGLNLTDVTSAVQASWDHSDNGHSFVTALNEQGFDVSPGEKAGVYVVLKNGAVLGSLDRLLKKRRREVSDRMMETNNMKEKNNEPESTTKACVTSNHGASKSDIRSSHRERWLGKSAQLG